MKFKGTKSTVEIGCACTDTWNNFTIEVFLESGNSIAKFKSSGTSEEAQGNANLFVDALSIVQKCDLMPSDLLEQRDELLALLSRSIDEIENLQFEHNDGANGSYYLEQAKELIQKIKGDE